MAEAKTKRETVVESVTLENGRVTTFAGKRKMNKLPIFNEDGSYSGLEVEFRNGGYRFYPLNRALAEKTLAHGHSQKMGDEVASVEEYDDMILAMDELHEQLAKGEWGVTREGGSMSGASTVIQALIRVTGKSLDQVKAFLAEKLAQYQAKAKENGEEFTRADLYKSFKAAPSLKDAIAQIEAEKAAKSSKKTKLDAEGALVELAA